MSNHTSSDQRIADVVVDALQGRGWSAAEAAQIIQRLLKGGENATFEASSVVSIMMPFGKHKGESLDDISRIDLSYLHWLYRQEFMEKEYPLIRIAIKNIIMNGP